MIELIKKHTVLFGVIAAALMLAAAWGFQMQGYYPCKLCWWQRYPYMVAVPLGGFMVWQGFAAHRISQFIMSGLFLTTSAIGLFHTGVERRWWEGPDTCTGAADLSGSAEAALEAILSAPIVRCDEVVWSLFGLSMASYNMLIGLGLAGVMIMAPKSGKDMK